MKIAIYQIDTDRDTERRAFKDFQGLLHIFGDTQIKSEIYDKVFSGEVECESLEDVYLNFNQDYPSDYSGRSLSVSDIVEVIEADSVEKGCYFCDYIGFKPVVFSPEKTRDLTSDKLITVLYIEPDKAPRVVRIMPELSEMQRLVGGYIEEFMPFDDDVAIICNEEGKLDGLPLNRAIYDENDGKKGEMIEIIAGSFFLANAPYESENFTSMTPELIKKYEEKFKYPESFMKINGGIIAIQQKPTSREHDR